MKLEAKTTIPLTLALISILGPYTLIIFFSNTIDGFTLLGLEFLWLCMLVTGVLWFWVSIETRLAPALLAVIAVAAVVIYLLYFPDLMFIADKLFVIRKGKFLNEFVSEIKQYKKISEMSDALRHTKNLNEHIIELDSTSLKKSYFAIYIDEALLKEGIDKLKYEEFRSKLIESGFISFRVADEEKVIFFTVDGFIDNSYGFAYVETGHNPEKANGFKTTYWRHIIGNWYTWSSV